MSQKERVDLIEVDLLDMCKYILSKWVFILIGMVVFAGAGFGYAKVKSVTEYSSKMQVYVTVPKTSDKVLIRDSASEMAYDYVQLVKTDLIIDKVAKEAKLSKNKVRKAISAEVVEGSRLIQVEVKSDSQKDVKKISKEVLPVFQKVVQKDLGRNKLVIAAHPSKIKAEQTVSTKKFLAVGAVGGFVVVAGVFFVLYLVDLTKKAKRN
ncbi:YveK family protein [Anaerostipes hadrus]|uniref:YveK family protein n=1 Tax=Anaerostipes hadrus TaxID=649756 RepID=UPI001FD7343F|nr:Wzz/FepE/Etk N-terminal domain-containing protein [Anaerostipes hadrus]